MRFNKLLRTYLENMLKYLAFLSFLSIPFHYVFILLSFLSIVSHIIVILFYHFLLLIVFLVF
jgi:hypothetical protein